MQMTLKPTTALIIDKRRLKHDNTFPVKLRITFERKQIYYSVPFNLTEIDFLRTMYGTKLTLPEKNLKASIQAFENKATEAINKLPFFTWKAFEKHYLTNRGAKDTINLAFADYAKELRDNDRIGTAVSYECAQSSLNKFSAGAKFADVTPDFLRKYEKWMLNKGNSTTTVSIYLRSLRTLFNNAISDGMLSKEFYPFGKKRYEIPTGNNTKKALSLKDIAAIYYYQPIAGTNADMAKDYWLFMYLCNGINVKDMCLLKYENIKGEVLEFERAKTSRTKRKVEAIRVALVDDAKDIIKKWGNKRGDGSTYIFPVLTKGITAVRERQLIQQLTGVVNDHMKAIAGALGIEATCTTYAARHSFATILQRSGASTEFISEALGHSNVRTTQNYLAGFEDDSKKETVKALTAFKA
jgi:integrase